jgi:ATP-dependent DNA ligase
VDPTQAVCEVAYAEWTDDEQLRQTTFVGWRDNKNAEEVRRTKQKGWNSKLFGRPTSRDGTLVVRRDN